MASGPITSWQTDGKTEEIVADFILGGSKITADGDCSHEIKRCLLLGYVRIWELDYKESWAMKNWCFWTVVLEKTLESPLDCKEIQPVHPKGDQSWVFIERNDVEAETPILWPPDVKRWLIGKGPDVGKDWRQKKKGTTEDEMVGWHHRLNGSWIWVNSGSWWRTGSPGVMRSMGSQRVRHDWATEMNWTDST